ncbi:hypothetical protein ABK040_005182 [Willaertia magna]
MSLSYVAILLITFNLLFNLDIRAIKIHKNHKPSHINNRHTNEFCLPDVYKTKVISLKGTFANEEFNKQKTLIQSTHFEIFDLPNKRQHLFTEDLSGQNILRFGNKNLTYIYTKLKCNCFEDDNDNVFIKQCEKGTFIERIKIGTVNTNYADLYKYSEMENDIKKEVQYILYNISSSSNSDNRVGKLSESTSFLSNEKLLFTQRTFIYWELKVNDYDFTIPAICKSVPCI